MRKYLSFIMASAIVLTIHESQGQNRFVSIEKNFNVRAKDLSHDLNATCDTLILKSPKTIDYVYDINDSYKREIDLYSNSNQLKIPLNLLSNGKHVFVVGSQRMQIIFVVRVQPETDQIAFLEKKKTSNPGD